MTLKQAINKADALKPNAFSTDQKTDWINECEGVIQTEIFQIDIDDLTTYDYQENQDTALMVRPPHDKLYVAYLYAMIDFANGEGSQYENSMTMFNSHLTEFTIWFARNYAPADNEDAYLNYIVTDEDEEGDDE